MAMTIELAVLCVLTPCSDDVGCQRFEWPCCLHLQGEGRDLNNSPELPVNKHYVIAFSACLSVYTKVSGLSW